MPGVSISLDVGAFDATLARLGPLVDFDAGELMSSIGALGESQTRRRITDEKAAPDGGAWPANLEGTSILLDTGRNLLASVAWTASASEAEWGASWQYAHVHQFGAVIRPKDAAALSFTVGGRRVHAKQVTIPAREFVGISADNATEILELVTDFLQLGQIAP